jgi:hypothetical protein
MQQQSIYGLYMTNFQFLAGPRGHAVWGIGPDRFDTDTVGLNPA